MINNNIAFPLQLTFKIVALSNQFSATDVNGQLVTYVKQKKFAFKENVKVFADANQTELLYQIKADKWIDFSANYSFTDAAGKFLGSVSRKGMRSIWKATYEIYDENKNQEFIITEENAWVKVLDTLLSELPIVGILNGYFFNPSYIVKRQDGTEVARLKKNKSFFGRSFTITKLGNMDEQEQVRVLLGLKMMILLERFRG